MLVPCGAHIATVVTKLPDSSVHRKIIDDSTIVEPCPICLQNGDIGVEMVMLRCECPHWGHESCMAKSVFETGGCPTCSSSHGPFQNSDNVQLLHQDLTSIIGIPTRIQTRPTIGPMIWWCGMSLKRAIPRALPPIEW
jgi:hypothetical protein